jgi:ArsR family transcriptional regulator
MAMSADSVVAAQSGLDEMMDRARVASQFLKALSNENRLLLLCLLAEGEKSVSELEQMLGLRQPAISQQLARLRAESLVAHRRHGKLIYYSLASEEARRIMELLHELFCAPAEPGPPRAASGK